MKSRKPDLLEKFQLPNTQSYLGSMGIYVFKKEALIQLLQETGDDFGKELIPLMIQRKNTYAFIYKGYWEDIGTVASFYEANLALIDQKNCLDIRDAERPIYTESQHLPNALIKNTLVDRSIISPGCVIEAKEICHSLIGTRTEIGKGSIIRDTLIMGNLGSHDEGVLSIGCDCFIQKAIIDEQVEIGSHVELLNKKNLQHYDGDGIFIRDGIIIVTSGTKVPDHFVL